MNTAFIINHRLLNQQIAGTDLTKPEELVNWLVAMQAQEFGMAKWAIGLRLPGANDHDIEQAFTEGRILRTHLMRPTWHFVTPPDIRWLLALTAPRINALSAFMFRQLELDAAIFKRSNKVLEKALEGGKFLTRAELKNTLQQKKIIADGLRLGYLMMRAEIEGLICSGPRRGKQFTYALLEERVKPVSKISREEALVKFAGRYFASRGPATLKDFAVWSGLSMQDVKIGASNLPSSFVRQSWRDQEYIFESKSLPAANCLQKNFLMPIYDEYGMSYKDRSHLFDAKMNPGGPTIFNNLIVLNGVAAGGWTRNIDGKKLRVETFPFTQLNKTNQTALQKTVARFRKFYE